MNRLEGFSDDELDALEQRIGSILLKLPLIAKHAGHKRPLNTLRDYIQVTDS